MANILIVDDSKSLLQMIKTIFQMHNYEVRTALTQSSLMAHMDIFKPDVILLDVVLDGSNGREVCRELKSNNETKNIPVILLSGSHELLRNYEECHADDIIEKPFEFEDVERKIKNVLTKKYSSNVHKIIAE